MCQVNLQGQKAVKIIASITRMVLLHPTPHSSSTLPADILREVGMDQPSQNSWGGRTEEGMEVWAHLSTSSTEQRCLSVLPCSFSHALRAGSVPIQAVLGAAGL